MTEDNWKAPNPNKLKVQTFLEENTTPRTVTYGFPHMGPDTTYMLLSTEGKKPLNSDKIDSMPIAVNPAKNIKYGIRQIDDVLTVSIYDSNLNSVGTVAISNQFNSQLGTGIETIIVVGTGGASTVQFNNSTGTEKRSFEEIKAEFKQAIEKSGGKFYDDPSKTLLPEKEAGKAGHLEASIPAQTLPAGQSSSHRLA